MRDLVMVDLTDRRAMFNDAGRALEYMGDMATKDAKLIRVDTSENHLGSHGIFEYDVCGERVTLTFIKTKRKEFYVIYTSDEDSIGFMEFHTESEMRSFLDLCNRIGADVHIHGRINRMGAEEKVFFVTYWYSTGVAGPIFHTRKFACEDSMKKFMKEMDDINIYSYGEMSKEPMITTLETVYDFITSWIEYEDNVFRIDDLDYDEDNERLTFTADRSRHDDPKEIANDIERLYLDIEDKKVKIRLTQLARLGYGKRILYTVDAEEV